MHLPASPTATPSAALASFPVAYRSWRRFPIFRWKALTPDPFWGYIFTYRHSIGLSDGPRSVPSVREYLARVRAPVDAATARAAAASVAPAATASPGGTAACGAVAASHSAPRVAADRANRPPCRPDQPPDRSQA